MARRERSSKKRRGADGATEPQKRGDTRQELIDAALHILAEDRGGLAGLSLREVTRKAGVSPTAFYRHFPDMEELGLAMLDESGDMLRRMLREVRKVADPQEMVGQSCRTFVSFVQDNRSTWLAISRERVGGSVRMRAAIRNQMAYFATELASDLRLLNIFPQLTQAGHYRLASMVIGLAVNLIPEVIDMPEGQAQAQAQEELIEDMTKQLGMLLMGAVHWGKPESMAAVTERTGGSEQGKGRRKK